MSIDTNLCFRRDFLDTEPQHKMRIIDRNVRHKMAVKRTELWPEEPFMAYCFVERTNGSI